MKKLIWRGRITAWNIVAFLVMLIPSVQGEYDNHKAAAWENGHAAMGKTVWVIWKLTGKLGLC